MKAYTASFVLFHTTLVVRSNVPLLMPKVEATNAELLFDLGSVQLFVTRGRAPAVYIFTWEGVAIDCALPARRRPGMGVLSINTIYG
jgi:hypothetical protein